ncbi:MAG: hypothetical protein V4660_18500 [Pseudomonadota bacterium]
MRDKAFFIAVAIVSMLAMWWLSSSNTDVPLSESEKSDAVSPLTENGKSAAPEVFYSPPTAAKPNPAHTLDSQESLPSAQVQSLNETANETTGEARLPSDDRLPAETVSPEETINPELGNEYVTGQETELNNDYVEAVNPEEQAISQQLQAMRDAGLSEAAVREVEEKLIQLQRLQDQQSISKSNPEDGSDFSP